MLGPGLFRVFRNRWLALWWSAGVLLTAYCSIPDAESSDPKVQAEQDRQAQQLAAAVASMQQTNKDLAAAPPSSNDGN